MVTMIASVLVLLLPAVQAGATAVPQVEPSGSSSTAMVVAAGDPTIAAAGDIGCGARDRNYRGGSGTATACRMKYTSDLLVSGGYSAVLALGDNMQSDPSPTGFATVFDSTWGRVKSLIHPVAGNHEYGYSAAKGYFGYFGAAAGPAKLGYYSFDIGAWHVVALNSNCAKLTGGCARGGAQELWLKADLAAHPGGCTLAFHHHARYSSGHGGDNTFMKDLDQDLYNSGVDVLLSGHSHDYERFDPQDNAAHLDQNRGITQFVVGTGGAFFTGLGARHANSAASQNSTFGVLGLTLHSSSYDWHFQPEAGKTWTDNGTRACHASAPTGNDFSLTASPSSVSVAPGQLVTSSISTTVTSGTPQNVVLTVSGLPVGASTSFTPASVSAGCVSTMTMTITTATTTPVGSSTLTVTGTGASATHAIPVVLTVTSGRSSTPALRQSAGGMESTAANSLTTTLPSPTVTGDLLVLTASVYTGTSNPLAEVTDSAGNTWIAAGRYAVAAHNSDGELWYSANAKPITQVTARTTSASVMAVRVMEFSGVAATGPLVTATGSSNSSTSASAGTVTPANSADLVVGFAAGHGSAHAMTVTTAGFTTVGQQTSSAGSVSSVVSGFRLANAVSPVTFTASFAAPMYWAAGIAAFRAATGP